MNKVVKCLTVFSVLALVLTLFVGPPALAKPENDASLSKPAIARDSQQFDGNRIANWLTNNGKIVDNDVTGGSGCEWPNGSNNTIDYASGLWIAGKDAEGSIRTACAEYASEFGAGPINADGTPANEDDPAYKIYKINSDGTGDWDTWPVDQGAPVDENGDPKLIGDQTMFFVINDAEPANHANLFSTKPMGLEIQTLVFGFNRSDQLGDIMFMQWKVINKSTVDYDSCFITVWDDPDLGDASDDLVGCDTTLSMGYVYNGAPVDATYGAAPPAMGFDFFQGPLVDGHRLGMSSFNFFWNGAPDPYGDPESPEQCLNFMRGVLSDGTPSIDPVTGEPSPFVFSGDPVAGTGWLDSVPDDRRFMINSGPFTMAAGDTQVVVGAKIIAQGSNYLSSVAALKYADAFAQSAFDNNFVVANPEVPSLTGTDLDGQIVLSWDDSDKNARIEKYAQLGYTFEGYNVYQGESETGPWTLIKTYDVNNATAVVYDDVFDASTGYMANIPVAYGQNTGIQRYFTIDKDYVSNLPLYNYKKYYFAVADYIVNLNATPVVVESGKSIVTVVPSNAADMDPNAAPQEVITVEHTTGLGSVAVSVEVIDPTKITGHDYQVEFTTGTTDTTWSLKDVTANTYVLENQKNFSGDKTFEITDGFLMRVEKLGAGGIAKIVELDADGEIYDTNLLGSLNNYGRSQEWPVFVVTESDGTTASDIDRFGSMAPNDYEIIFDSSDPTLAWSYYTDAVLVDADGNPCMLPFKVLKTTMDGVTTRLPVCVLDQDENGKWERVRDGVYGTPAFEMLYIYDNAVYDPAELDNYIAAGDGTVAPGYGPWGDAYPAINRFTFEMYFDVDGYATADMLDADGVFYGPPADGEHVKIITSKPITSNDLFSFSTAGPSTGTDLAKEQLEKINAVPNPYFGYNPAERTPTDRVMRFTNLAKDSETTIRIFDLAGNAVRVIDEAERAAQGTEGAAYAEWDLRNSADVPVASGVYLVYIDVKDVGTKVIKVAVVNRDERLLYY